MLKARDLTLQLWSVALARLAMNNESVEGQRLLETLILSIAQREEFRVEFLGWRRNKVDKLKKNATKTKKTKKKGKQHQHQNQRTANSGPVGVRHNGNPQGRSASVGGQAFPGFGRHTAFTAPPSSTTTTTAAPGSVPPTPLFRPPRSGAFNPKKEKSLDHGRMYCQMLESTMMHVTQSIETIETSFNAPRRSSLSSGPAVIGSIFDSTGPSYLYPDQLKCYASIIVLAWFRLPTIVPLAMGWIRKTLEEVGEDLLVTNVKPAASAYPAYSAPETATTQKQPSTPTTGNLTHLTHLTHID